jgi:hypothetical protein
LNENRYEPILSERYLNENRYEPILRETGEQYLNEKRVKPSKWAILEWKHFTSLKFHCFFHLTWNRVIAAVRINWKIRQGVMIFAISCSTFEVRETVVIIRTMSFFYSTLTSNLRRTACPCLCISGSRPITTNWIIYKEYNLKY